MDGIAIARRHRYWIVPWLIVLATYSVVFGQDLGPPRTDDRPWDLAVRVFSEYNTNVPLAADVTTFAGEEKSLGAGISAAGNYRFIQEDPWGLGVGLAAVQTGYIESDVDDFNYTSLAPSVFGHYKFDLGALPAVAAASLTVRHDMLDFETFQTSVSPLLTLTVFPMPRLATSVYVGLSLDEFDDDGANPSVTSRDAVQYRVGVNARYAIPNDMKQSVGAGAEFRHNDADGDDFVYNAFSLTADFASHIAGPVSGVVAVGYTNENYTDFTTDPERDQDNVFITLTLLVALSPELTFDAYYSYLNMASDSDAFELDRSIVGVGLTWRP